MTAGTAAAPGAERPPFWRNVRVLRIVFQVAFIFVVLTFLTLLYLNLTTNLRRQGIRTDFGYLQQPAGFNIAGSDFRSSQAIWRAIWVGVQNTALVAFLGIVLATMLGILVGIARLSSNWLVRRTASLYVESFRNVPVLVIIIFMYTAVFLKLPAIERAYEWLGIIVLSNRGLWLPWIRIVGPPAGFLAVLLAGMAVAYLVGRWRTARFDATGQPHHRVWWGAAAFLAVTLVGYLALGRPLTFSVPARTGLAVLGGYRLTAEYGALLFALVLYTTTHVAEIVRGSILSVPKGQSEAATALGLSGPQRLRFVVLPQAFRVAIPPTGNQFLNLTKNSSLAVAIAFPEVTRISEIIIGNGHPAPQSIAILMGVYLCFSLFLSVITNLFNRRMQLVER